MKLLYQGMKKLKKNLWSEKVPFGYEKKPVFENFPFHTLGYENFGCFFLMRNNVAPEQILFDAGCTDYADDRAHIVIANAAEQLLRAGYESTDDDGDA
jgi:hypothetical protein